MSEQKNELKKVLAENGNFDAEKAKQTAERAVFRFNRRVKWTERTGLFIFLIFFAVFVFALIQFAAAYTTKAMIAYSLATLISFGMGLSTALIAGVQTMLMRVLKEIKQSQLEHLGFAAECNVSQSGDGPFSDVRPRVLAWREIAGWKLAFVATAFLVLLGTRWFSAYIWPSDMARFDGAPVTIEAPQIGAPVYYTIYIRMDKGVCKVSRITSEHKQSELFTMGKGFVNNGTLPPGDSLRLDPQGNEGEYWVRFE
jgi:hypothetical protein